MPHNGEYRIGRRGSREGRYRWIHATDMAQRRCHGKAGSFGKVNRCASHAAAYVQHNMDSRIEAQLHRLILENTSIANLQTIKRIGVQCALAPNTASPLRLRLQKALKTSAQGNAGL
ncbi:hypothetical protein SDC9_16846 [bioreactor metagenome]|uniref:Uncharacterized protein n=1 Tax=bioreactor metagenome TaxID=1076179 RepID=A0A644TVQ7_9ZZZZ